MVNFIKNHNELIYEKIFESFIKKKKQTVYDIQKATNIDINLLLNTLSDMTNSKILEKKYSLKKRYAFYVLSKNAEKKIPFFAHFTGKEIGNLPIVVCAVVNNGRILLMKRKKRPYLGYYGLIGGKLKLSDTIEDCCIREVKEETGLECKFIRINSVLHERIVEDGFFKHAFVIFLCLLMPKTKKSSIISTEEGKAEWFDFKDIKKEKCIPSDYYMIMNLLNMKTDVKEILQAEKNGKLLQMKIL